MLHQGYENNTELWYITFDGVSWGGDVLVPNTLTTANPSAVVYQNKLWVLYQGNRNNGQGWYNIFDDKKWNGDTFLPGVGIYSGPSVVIWHTNLFYFTTESMATENCGIQFGMGRDGSEMRIKLSCLMSSVFHLVFVKLVRCKIQIISIHVPRTHDILTPQ